MVAEKSMTENNLLRMEGRTEFVTDGRKDRICYGWKEGQNLLQMEGRTEGWTELNQYKCPPLQLNLASSKFKAFADEKSNESKIKFVLHRVENFVRKG